MPPVRDIDIIGELEEALGHRKVLASFPQGNELVQLRAGGGDLFCESTEFPGVTEHGV